MKKAAQVLSSFLFSLVVTVNLLPAKSYPQATTQNHGFPEPYGGVYHGYSPLKGRAQVMNVYINKGAPGECRPLEKTWKFVKRVGVSCFYYERFPKPLNGYVVRVEDRANVESAHATCIPDPFDSRYVVCYNPGDEAPDAPPTSGPPVPALQPEFPEEAQPADSFSIGTSMLSGGAQLDQSGVEVGTIQVNGVPVTATILNSHPNGYFIDGASIPSGTYSKVSGFVLRNYRNSGTDYFMITQLVRRSDGQVSKNLEIYVALAPPM